MGNNKIEPDKRIIRAVFAVLLLALILIAYFFDPVFYKITDCGFKNITGVSCPGCGLTRSFHAFANFQLNEAFAFHLIGPILFLGFVILFLKFAFEVISGNIINVTANPKWVRNLIILFVLVWIGYWVVRMIWEIPR